MKAKHHTSYYTTKSTKNFLFKAEIFMKSNLHLDIMTQSINIPHTLKIQKN